MRYAGESIGLVPSGLIRMTSCIVAALALVLPGCDSPTANPVPHVAAVSVRGQVIDPSGTGVEAAVVTFRFHETPSCTSSEFATSSVETDEEGSFSAGPPGLSVDEGFLPREVCMEVRAEPPSDRPGLAVLDSTGFVVTLQDQLSDEPLDEVEVNLTLPEAAEN